MATPSEKSEYLRPAIQDAIDEYEEAAEAGRRKQLEKIWVAFDPKTAWRAYHYARKTYAEEHGYLLHCRNTSRDVKDWSSDWLATVCLNAFMIQANEQKTQLDPRARKLYPPGY